MSNKLERGARSERSSALWGTGSRGGDRSSVLWGNGGRGIVVSCLAALALAAPLTASAGSGSGSNNSGFIAPGLLDKSGSVDVIIQSNGGTSDAFSKAKGLGVFEKDIKQLGLIGAVEVTAPAAQLKKLQGLSGIT